MNYKLIYDNIINRGKTRVLSEYKETHHIIPRCLGGSDDSENLVELTPEEHYVVHQLLVKIYPTNKRLLYAAMMMTAGTKYVKRNNKLYGWLKRRFSEGQTGVNHIFNRDHIVREKNQDYMRGPNNPSKLNPRKRKNHHNYGKPFDPSCFTEEGLRSMSESKRGAKNPNAGIKAWNHPRATDYSKSIWKQADIIYQIWLNNNKPSYCKLYTLVNNKCYTNESKVIGPYMNMVKYFRNDWVPMKDEEWVNALC